ncbi:glycosyltransferase involved in cell wall biosynthesis [Lachnotalea glycerini]|uniref:Glycosyltransferase involved in cell wall biosynthesis n=1 Tax=Lachnotalea glycerini TaxID=1763509 RepID=A0A318ESU3_9FIRM|nr:glycosyltransferase [Lachnotalea glycerini]PXV91461.1 glycosyltransferase involved in cell wall biosynthesis [Lachnotalea glycerini]
MEKDRVKLNQIVLIGPVYPYKGGISHYTGAMYHALDQEYSVEMISFKLQYPKFLFKKEQRDYQNKTFMIDNTKFLINTVNPLSWFKAARYIKKVNPDLVVVQWWHPYFSPCYWGMLQLLSRFKKILVCHNVFPHESFPLDRFLTQNVLRKGNGFIVQSSMDEKDLKSIIKRPKFKKVVHPTYNVFKFQDMDKQTARAGLGLQKNEKIILFFGFVRGYKGLKYLISAMPDVKRAYQDIKLLIVGEFGGDKTDYIRLISEKQVADCIKIFDQYVPDTEIQQYFVASDLVVLPYESATQSGIVQMAYGFEKPVIATEVGGLPEVVIENKTGYIVTPKSADDLAKAIIKFYNEDKELEFIQGVKEEAYRYSWERMTELITELYKEL